MSCNGIGAHDTCQKIQAAVGSAAAIVLLVVGIIIALKVITFVTGLLFFAACGLALLCCASFAIDSCSGKSNF